MHACVCVCVSVCVCVCACVCVRMCEYMRGGSMHACVHEWVWWHNIHGWRFLVYIVSVITRLSVIAMTTDITTGLSRENPWPCCMSTTFHRSWSLHLSDLIMTMHQCNSIYTRTHLTEAYTTTWFMITGFLCHTINICRIFIISGSRLAPQPAIQDGRREIKWRLWCDSISPGLLSWPQSNDRWARIRF